MIRAAKAQRAEYIAELLVELGRMAVEDGLMDLATLIDMAVLECREVVGVSAKRKARPQLADASP